MPTSSRAANLGPTINYYRLRRGLTSAQLATLVGVTPSTITTWERNRARPGYKHIPALCTALGISPGILFGMDELTVTERRIVDNLRRLTPEQVAFVDETVAGMVGHSAPYGVII